MPWQRNELELRQVEEEVEAEEEHIIRRAKM
jgi:hypothetical protein